MDVNCPNCGEPWDMDSLHDEAAARYGVPFFLTDEDRRAHRRNPAYDSEAYQMVYREVSAAFRAGGAQGGCNALSEAFGSRCTPSNVRPLKAQAAGLMYELLGDDLDGAASMLEDLDALGL